ncbi:MAG: hypothetical protein CM15mP60_3480 [Alphaproteobacteria bacterium]|nr:MAG: hypothetical protein CM15mP60_3480 [Alphaproteobacteria bacterium]
MFSSFSEDVGLSERPFELSAESPARAWPEPRRLQQILAKLVAAKRPILIGGHGVWGQVPRKAREGRVNLGYQFTIFPITETAQRAE